MKRKAPKKTNTKTLRYVPEKTKLLLWGKAAGRCEYDGCNTLLYRDTTTAAEFNIAYIAHIIAASADGPRGDAVLSPQLKDNIDNLMLLCDTCHRRVDREDIAGHPIERSISLDLSNHLKFNKKNGPFWPVQVLCRKICGVAAR